MNRWLFVLLLLIVPFQMVWASAAPYCAHETDTGPKMHFGHHEHRHQVGGEITPALDDDGIDDASGAYHADCERCHLGCSATLAVPTVTLETLAKSAVGRFDDPSYVSHIPIGPERPDRNGPTPAARFGGGVVSGSLNC